MQEYVQEPVREEQRTRNFNPNDHVIQLKSKQGAQDYLPVQWRLVWFREQYPQGTIDTEEMEVDLDREMEVEAFVWNAEKRRSEKVTRRAKGYARFKATVTDGKGGRATGTGSESAADFPDFVEKAETKAIGRALAALGFGTQFAPELNEEHRIVDSPVNRNGSLGNNGYNNGLVSGAEVLEARAQTNGNSNGVNGNNGHGHTNHTAEEQENASEVDAKVTEQQLNSIRKLCERLGKAEPNNITAISYLSAKKLIQILTSEYRKQQQSKAS